MMRVWYCAAAGLTYGEDEAAHESPCEVMFMHDDRSECGWRRVVSDDAIIVERVDRPMAGGRRRLRKPCIHDRYDEHRDKDTGMTMTCPGGEFLPEDAELVERIRTAFSSMSMVDRYDEELVALTVFNALADQVGEPG